MPQILRIGPYSLYFWSNESDPLEPIHIHISEGRASAAATKVWITSTGKDSLLLEFVQTATKNDAVVKLMKEEFGKIEVVRGGSVGIESINVMER